MSSSPWDFVENILDALHLTAPGTGAYDVGECEILAIAEIDRLQMRDKFLAALEKEQEKTMTRVERIKLAADLVRAARSHLRSAGANKAADYVARALKSVEGAQQHARGLETREMMNNG